MRWWDARPVPFDDLVVGLQYLNEASNVAGEFQKYSEMSDALSAFSKGYIFARYGTLDGFTNDAGHAKEAQIIREYARDAFSTEVILALLQAPPTTSIAELRPLIYDEEAVDREIRQRNVRKDDLPQEVFEAARRSHRTFTEARKRALNVQTAENLRDANVALARLLYLVRCNLNHPGKTRFGPDPVKGERDWKVVWMALPVLYEFLQFALDSPNRRLGVYGSLLGSGDHHAMISDLGEAVAHGRVRGRIAIRDGYPVMTWDNSGEDVPIEIYESRSLTNARWKDLDAWEGLNYRRTLVPVELENGEHLVGTIYAAIRETQ